ncbi:helix-turn-helix domain-containing protein [Pseudomonas sp. Pseu.R1]|uniref:helix-turn-helix domain-containing protein n=1 Tax=Pseudomonas sp. Pseu.R1 TaxID=3379818 RepID=UPI003B963DFD
MDRNQAFARVFRRLRSEKGIAQADFEGVATSRYVRKLEKGLATPTLLMLESLSGELGLSAAAFVALTLAETENGIDPNVLRSVVGELETLIKGGSDKA